MVKLLGENRWRFLSLAMVMIYLLKFRPKSLQKPQWTSGARASWRAMRECSRRKGSCAVREIVRTAGGCSFMLRGGDLQFRRKPLPLVNHGRVLHPNYMLKFLIRTAGFNANLPQIRICEKGASAGECSGCLYESGKTHAHCGPHFVVAARLKRGLVEKDYPSLSCLTSPWLLTKLSCCCCWLLHWS